MGYCVSLSLPTWLAFRLRFYSVGERLGRWALLCLILHQPGAQGCGVPVRGCAGAFFSDLHGGAGVPLGFPPVAVCRSTWFSTWFSTFPRGMLHPSPEVLFHSTPPKGGDGIGIVTGGKRFQGSKNALKPPLGIDHRGPPRTGRGMWQCVPRRGTSTTGSSLLFVFPASTCVTTGGRGAPLTHARKHLPSIAKTHPHPAPPECVL